MKIYRVIAMATLLTSTILIACTKKSAHRISGNPADASHKIFVYGEPLNLIAGTKKNQKFDGSFFSDTEKVYRFQVLEFKRLDHLYAHDWTEEELADDDSDFEILPTDKKPKAEPLNVQYNREKNEVILDAGGGLAFTFANNKNGVGYVSYDNDGIYESEEIQHVSVSADGNLMSIMMSGGKGDDYSVVIWYLAKQWQPGETPRATEPYHYLTGVGRKVGWKKDNQRPLEVCYSGENKEVIEQITRDAGQKWQQALGSHLPLEVKIATEPKPFSDLNQSCLYIVDQYLTMIDSGFQGYGVTLWTVDWHLKPNLADADILLFASEFLNNGASIFDQKSAKNLIYTIKHEIGHWLGLEHKLHKDVPSLMSYDFEGISPTLYDEEAIRALYE